MTAGGGLRRFVGPRTARPPQHTGSPSPQADRSPRPAGSPSPQAAPSGRPGGETCDLCASPAPEPHGHIVDLENRSLMCACRPCFLLFDRDGGRFRAVPDRYLRGQALTAGEWRRLGIPVGSAFFLRGASGVAAFYPSPGGATQCLLDLDAWAELATAHPLLADVAPDVEAILVRDLECFLVPIDACYRLVGTIRAYWKGFDGGQEARERVDAFFADLRARAV
ncbi:DUF5947 family protein [Nonomuraea sp. NPDC050643]|uniref:DUF5947 family protein n=1 Tax=Nonomuraea sp. NPDC050643 TaxID=3155660 RepID=UPI0034082D79